MKWCKYCGKQIPDASKFCTYCGKSQDQPVQTKPKLSVSAGPATNQKKPVYVKTAGSDSGQKKMVQAAALCGLLAAVGLGSWFFFSKIQSHPVQDLFSAGERYLYEADYAQAEEVLLKARELEPKNPEVYERLEELYVKSDQDQKVDIIREQAKEELETPDFNSYTNFVKDQQEKWENEVIESEARAEENSASGKNSSDSSSDKGKKAADDNKKTADSDQKKPDKIKSRNKTDSYETVLELGKLDLPPIPVGDEGWVISKNQKFGLIDKNGKMYENPTKESWTEITLQDEPFACVADAELSQNSQVSMPAGQQCTGFGGVRGVDYYYLTDDQSIESYNPLSSEIKHYTLDDLASVIETPKFMIRKAYERSTVPEDYFEDEPYYIYNPAEKELYGPYKPDEIAGFGYYSLLNTKFNSLYSLSGAEQVYSPFYVKNGDKYSIYSKDGNKHLDGFTKAAVISTDLIGGYKENQFILYDSDLKELYSKKIEAGSKTINGLTPIQENKEWKIVRYSDKKDEESQKDDQKRQDSESGKAETGIGSAAGSYRYSSGDESYILNLQKDGSFTLEYLNQKVSGNGDSIKTGFSYKGSMKESDLKLNNHQTLKTEKMKTSAPADGVQISQAPSFIKDGMLFEFIQAGSKLSDIPGTMDSLKSSIPVESDGETLKYGIFYNSDLNIPLIAVQ